MTNIKDVAKEAGVSISTVSRVLNGTASISISTRTKVEDAIKKLNYHPHQIARALSKKQSFIIGVIIPDSAHPFFSELIKHIEYIAESRGYKVLICNSFNNKDKELSYTDMLKEYRVDGIIMGSHNLYTEYYKGISRPIIAFDRNISPSIPYVTSDNFSGGEMATLHLINKGCKNLLHISGPCKLNMLANRRSDAFKITCMENNINYKIIECENKELTYDYFYDFISNKLGDKVLNYDGIFCSNDLLAYALYVYCQNNGIKVPKQLKIIGYDNTSYTRMLQNPKITTIAQPINLIGEVLCTTLINLIEKEPQNKTYSQMLPIELIQGTTT